MLDNKANTGAIINNDKPEDHQMPEADQTGHIQRSQNQGHDGISTLAHEDDLSSSDAVRHSASQQGGEGQGKGKGHHDQGEGKGGVVRELKDQPPPGDLLHRHGRKRENGAQP